MTQMTIQQAMQLAVSHHQAGRLGEAEGIYRQILAAQPAHVDALHLMGVLASQCGQAQAAVDLINRAIAIQPAEARYRSNLGQILLAMGRMTEAVDVLRAALEIDPNIPEAWNNLGNALSEQRQFEEAVAAYRRAMALQENFAEAHSNLGNALKEQGHLDEAIASVRRSLELRPDFPASHNNLGMCLRQKGEYREAVAEYREAIKLLPDLAVTHYNLAVTLLVLGEFDEGFSEYEWRFQSPQVGVVRPKFAQPEWDGSDPAGKRLLIYAEQGLGDTIQFARYLPLAAKQGAKTILQCQGELARLLRNVEGVEQIISPADSTGEFDSHCPLLSLPRIFKTTVSTIPASIPYLASEAELASRWRERLEEHKAKLKVGLVWAGRLEHTNDRNRSIALKQLEPLQEVEGVTFFSLQIGNDQKEEWLIDLAGELTDFAETAAVIENLDLLITVDTAAAHLAGAMGKRVWLLLPFSPDWRWLLDREDSPWYPTMRLFRQPAIGDWQTPISRVVQALQELKHS